MIRVLMVDDEPLVRRGIVAGVDWAALGCEVVGEAQSGEEGLALARKLKPELIITDIRMPKMDGITMMNLLREEGCAAHCIVLTAHSDFEYARGALLFGADDYLLKPFRDQELTHAVARVCRKMQPLPAAPAQQEKEPEVSGYVRQAMDYIAAHYADRGHFHRGDRGASARQRGASFPCVQKADRHDRHQLSDQDAH